jgi:ketosteroid isomerase-like protein
MAREMRRAILGLLVVLSVGCSSDRQLEWVLEGTHLGEWRLPGRQEPIPPTGRAVRAVGADLFGFNPAGEIESDEARIDVATLLNQISAPAGSSPQPAQLRELAERYTAAWGSQDAARVAAFYSPSGSLSVNGGPPAEGRGAITEVAQGFMTAFPDMEVLMDGLLVQGDQAVYQWTLLGTNTGPGGKGRRVRISGFEVWQIGADGLIGESRGHFDSAAYEHQLERGVDHARQ